MKGRNIANELAQGFPAFKIYSLIQRYQSVNSVVDFPLELKW